MVFNCYKDVRGEWRWRLKADNGEIIASGESYKNKQDCLHVIDLVKGSSDATVKETED